MFYKDKIDKIYEVKNEEKKELEDLDRYKEEIYLEKGDFISMVLGAYYAFLPIFLILLLILYLVRPWQ